MTHIVRLSDYRHRRTGRVYFTRFELSLLLGVYSEHVARGEWKDYAIDHATGIALFSVFRHTAERPAFAIAKIQTPRGADFAVFDDKRKLKRSAVLADALRVFDKGLSLVTD